MSTPSDALPSHGWSPTLDDALKRAIIESSRDHDAPLAVFDCDNTCIRGDIGDVLWESLVMTRALDFAHPELIGLIALVDPDPASALALAQDTSSQQEYITRWLPMYATASRELGYATGLTWVTQVMVGLSEEELQDHCARCVNEALAAPMESGQHPPAIRICQEVKAFIAELQAHGVTCAIVSASCRWPVQAVAPHLGIDPACVLAIDMVVEQGTLTSTIIPPITYRQGKLDAILARFDRPPQIVFGDAITDFEMLERATHLGVLIDRGNADILEAIAPHSHILAQPRDDLHFGS